MLLNTYKRKLAFRVIVFLAAVGLYLFYPQLNDDLLNLRVENITYLSIIWAILILEMIIVFAPRSKVSMGSLKLFKHNFQPRRVEIDKEVIKKEKRRLNIGALKVFISWIILNGIIAVLYFTHLIREKELFLISMAYYVSDLICVVYFCPFQRFFMKNRCCVVCRIFNWDQIMMVTPLFFIKGIFSWTLCAVAVFTFVQWEYNFYRHPERFMEVTNAHLSCVNCTDKCCKIKKPLYPKKKAT